MVITRKRRDSNNTFFCTFVFFCQCLIILYLYKHLKNSEFLNILLQKMRLEAFKESEKIRKEILELSKQNETTQFYNSIKFEAFCPKKVRIGGDGDSGKEIQKITDNRCKIVGADMAEQNQTTKEKYDKMRGQLFVGNIPDTLKMYRLMIDSESRDVEILKIDIESSEHEALEPFLKDYFVCQILIEIHGHPEKQLEMLRKLSRLGFRLFNLEPNPTCPICCEYSFINEMCMYRYQVTPLAILIP
ncbi:Protein CBG13744 [Caenorhabditis briggsae]|uniref:Protein CBG13744 n=1 Tax=Caenorhabditis briggsae TaxID=6238 RepID=A8XIL3_CAEBR|nr:Protein CBG13744 [Caenorhabditis briggsae]CAP32488.2 Protein CBG13744 [Caenorhabditis briggsae]